MQSRLQALTAAIGRILLSLIFILSGGHKLTAWQQTGERMENEGMVAVPLLLIGAVILELGGGLMVLLGFFCRIGAFFLIVFLIPTTLIFHDFWQYAGAEQQTQMIQFMKNLAILGGLTTLLSAGAGCCSLDSRRNRK